MSCRLLLLAFLALGVAPAARADVIFDALAASDPGITGNSVRSAGSAPLGLMTFSAPTTVSAIGIYDAMSLAGTQTFLIFDYGTGQLLYQSSAKAFAGDGGTTANLDSYKVSYPLNFTFMPGVTYEVGAVSTVTTGFYYATHAVTQNGITLGADNDNVSGVTAQGTMRCCSTGIELFETGIVTSVPEPATLALLGGSVVALGAMHRRSRPCAGRVPGSAP